MENENDKQDEFDIAADAATDGDPRAEPIDKLASDRDFHEPAAAEMPEARRMVLLAVLFEGGLAAFAWLVGWLVGYDPLQTFSWSAQAVWIGIVATLPLIAGLLLIDRFPLGPFADLKRVVDDLIVPLFADVNIAQFFLIALLAGVGEEMLFRGLLQGGIAELFQHWLRPAVATALALCVASFLFGLMHPITWLYAVLCFVVGFYLGALWIYTENLLVPIIVHAAYDFVALIYLVNGQSDKPTP